MIQLDFLMRRKFIIEKGLDLRLSGAVTATTQLQSVTPRNVAVVPDDFPGLKLKSVVSEGDEVAAGQALLADKNCSQLKVVSPVAGTVKAIVRGERRKIERIVVAAGINDMVRTDFRHDGALDAETVKDSLLQSGLWVFMRQRPFDIVPDPLAPPRDIFVTALDTAPLATPLVDRVAAYRVELACGVEALSLLTAGKVYVCGSGIDDIKGAEMIDFSGPHPAGNVGVQIANIAPVNKGDTVWALDIVTLARIGSLFLTGHVDFTTTVAVTGPEVEKPMSIKTICGVELRDLLDGNIRHDGINHRIISGNVLTGTKESLRGFLRYPYRQVTVIAEGDDRHEFMGWASMSPSKLSASRSFPSFFRRRHAFSPDARINGGRRAMIMSGVYDKVFPMDILPEYLVKAIMSCDIEKMEALGIYEVAPEDFALAEFLDPSKLELQKIVAGGLEYLRHEL